MNADETRELIRAAIGRSEGCPPVERLIDALFSAAPSAEQQGLLAHAEGCAACAAELELARAFDATPRSAAEAEEIAALSAGLEARSAVAPPMARVIPMRQNSPAPGDRRFPGWSRLAAAALVVLSVGLGLRWSGVRLSPELPDGPAKDIVRSGELQLEHPIGELEGRPVELAWQAVAGASTYRIEVRDVAGDQLFEAASPSPTLVLAGTQASLLESHVSYSWLVVARDAAGLEIARSTPATFRFKRD